MFETERQGLLSKAVMGTAGPPAPAGQGTSASSAALMPAHGHTAYTASAGGFIDPLMYATPKLSHSMGCGDPMGWGDPMECGGYKGGPRRLYQSRRCGDSRQIV